MNAARGLTNAQALEYVAVWNAAFMASDDLDESFAAFSARRAPRYTGR